MIVLKIDVTKIDKNHLFQGKSGKYLDAALHDKPNDFGDDGFITQSVSKEARAAGVKGPIIGNWRKIGSSQAKSAPPPQKNTAEKVAKPAAAVDDEDSSVPF